MSKIEKRHNSRLLVVFRISFQDLMNSSVVFSSKIERSIDIVIFRVVMLKNIRNFNKKVLLVEYDRHA